MNLQIKWNSLENRKHFDIFLSHNITFWDDVVDTLLIYTACYKFAYYFLTVLEYASVEYEVSID